MVHSKVNLIFSGPCGVGKSTIANFFALSIGYDYIDLDEHRSNQVETHKHGISPCSVTYLNIEKCLYSRLDELSNRFILDIGGDTVFRPSINNDDRKNQIQSLKKKYSAVVVVFLCDRDYLFQRFSSSTKRRGKSIRELDTQFNQIWADWFSIGFPYWESCSDFIIDTTKMTVTDIILQVENKLKS